MADVSKIKLPDNTEINIKDSRILGIDSTPTLGSTNPVTSGGVYTAINGIRQLPSVSAYDNGKYLSVANGEWAATTAPSGSTITVDSALSSTSENPVQNKIIYAAIGDIETLLSAL